MSHLYANVRSDDDSALTFYVGSRSRFGFEHTVDLEAFKGNGECTCERFQIRYRPHLMNGAHPSRLLQCWHIQQAMMELGHTTQVVIMRGRRKGAEEHVGGMWNQLIATFKRIWKNANRKN